MKYTMLGINADGETILIPVRREHHPEPCEKSVRSFTRRANEVFRTIKYYR